MVLNDPVAECVINKLAEVGKNVTIQYDSSRKMVVVLASDTAGENMLIDANYYLRPRVSIAVKPGEAMISVKSSATSSGQEEQKIETVSVEEAAKRFIQSLENAFGRNDAEAALSIIKELAAYIVALYGVWKAWKGIAEKIELGITEVEVDNIIVSTLEKNVVFRDESLSPLIVIISVWPKGARIGIGKDSTLVSVSTIHDPTNPLVQNLVNGLKGCDLPSNAVVKRVEWLASNVDELWRRAIKIFVARQYLP